MRPNNRGLVGDLTTPSHRLHCHKLPWTRTPCRHHHSQILAWTLFHPLPYCKIRLFGLSRFYSNWQIFDTSTTISTITSTNTSRYILILLVSSSLNALGLIIGCWEYRDEWCCYLTEVSDKSSIKVCKAQKHLNVSDWLRLWLVPHSLDSFFLHPNPLGRNDKT